MNEPRSTRYHRAQRWAAVSAGGVQMLVLTALLVTPGSRALRDALGGSAALQGGAVLALLSVAAAPADWYRFRLEREYDISRLMPAAALREYARIAILRSLAGASALTLVNRLIAVSPVWWWVPAALGGALTVVLLTAAAPVVMSRSPSRVRPLQRESLHERLAALADRAGVQPPRIQEWRTGGRSRQAAAALVGAGATRRILLSDTLLADYSDDEIEAVIAHELAHHVHGDVAKGLAAELAVITACCLAAAGALNLFWRPLGLSSPADPAGVPLLLLVIGAITLASTPLLNAASRRNERRADEYAVDLCSRPDAFASAMRRMAAQNLADEAPSRTAFLMFHTHPLVEDRIALVRDRSRARSR